MIFFYKAVYYILLSFNKVIAMIEFYISKICFLCNNSCNLIKHSDTENCLCFID